MHNGEAKFIHQEKSFSRTWDNYLGKQDMSGNMKGFLKNQTKNKIKIWISTENEKKCSHGSHNFCSPFGKGEVLQKKYGIQNDY